MKTLLWLDDLRCPSDYPHICKGYSAVYWAKNYKSALDLLNSGTEFTYMSLDNDLGESKEGKDIFNATEQLLFFNKLPVLKHINIHSHNPSAVEYVYSTKEFMAERYGIKISKIRA